MKPPPNLIQLNWKKIIRIRIIMIMRKHRYQAPQKEKHDQGDLKQWLSND